MTASHALSQLSYGPDRKRRLVVNVVGRLAQRFKRSQAGLLEKLLALARRLANSFRCYPEAMGKPIIIRHKELGLSIVANIDL